MQVSFSSSHTSLKRSDQRKGKINPRCVNLRSSIIQTQIEMKTEPKHFKITTNKRYPWRCEGKQRHPEFCESGRSHVASQVSRHDLNTSIARLPWWCNAQSNRMVDCFDANEWLEWNCFGNQCSSYFACIPASEIAAEFCLDPKIPKFRLMHSGVLLWR